MSKIYTFIEEKEPDKIREFAAACFKLGADGITIFSHPGAVDRDMSWLQDAMAGQWELTYVAVLPIPFLRDFVARLPEIDRELLTKGFNGDQPHKTSLLRRVFIPIGSVKVPAEIGQTPWPLSALPFPVTHGASSGDGAMAQAFPGMQYIVLKGDSVGDPEGESIAKKHRENIQSLGYIPTTVLDTHNATERWIKREEAEAATVARNFELPSTLNEDEKAIAEAMLAGRGMKVACNLVNIPWQRVAKTHLPSIKEKFGAERLDFQSLWDAAREKAGESEGGSNE